jgi:hypothetical protein
MVLRRERHRCKGDRGDREKDFLHAENYSTFGAGTRDRLFADYAD